MKTDSHNNNSTNARRKAFVSKGDLKTRIPGPGPSCQDASSPPCRGFTLIELLVVIAIIAIFLYADDNQDRLPPPLYDPDQFPGIGPYNSYLLFGWGGQVGQPAEPKL